MASPTKITLPKKVVATIALGGFALAALAGCSSASAPADSPKPSQSAQSSALPPVMADLGTVDGTMVHASVGETIVLTGDDKTFTSWEAQIKDPAIVSFAKGKNDGSAQFNPGLTALAVGETAVTLTNSASGKTVTFTVMVMK